MKIALLLPTRERMNNKINFMMSALARCKDPNNYTLYMGLDKDDPTLERCQKMAKTITNTSSSTRRTGSRTSLARRSRPSNRLGRFRRSR